MNEVQNTVLALASAALFGGAADPALITPEVCTEALAQAVLPLVYPSGTQLPRWEKMTRQVLAENIRVAYDHNQLHQLMTKNDIPYVVLKGMASASFYPNPLNRTMGDVDFLVRREDQHRAEAVLEESGFVSDADKDSYHVGYHCGRSTWELHNRVNGMPDGLPGEKLNAMFSDLMDSAVEYDDGNGVIRIPSPFHHGLILLLHTASHLTAEGVGLRHLCDWVVFAASMSDGEFRERFEEKLQSCGLWRFAQLLTLCGIRYLGAPARAWAGDAPEEVLEAMIMDILEGGNFGHKDAERPSQIKYISNRGERTVDKKSALAQVWNTIAQKAEAEHKSRVGVMLDYTGKVLSGKRKMDSVATLKTAENRKRLYSEFQLFLQEPKK